MPESDVNVNLSNGTCYFAQNTKTKGEFIPCGNIALGNWPCCHLGSVCLGFETANACWDYTTGNTYIAGCTDPGYYDKTCPDKSPLFDDQEWVAIQHCGTESNGDTDWGGCENNPANETDLAKLPLASCNPYCSSTLYVGETAINAYATVPTSAGGTVLWTSNFNPATRTQPGASAQTTTSAASSTAPSRTSTLSNPTATQTSQPQGNGLGTGAKVGIGIGSAAAALLILAVALLSLLIHRRRKKRLAQQQPGFGQGGGIPTAHPQINMSAAGYDQQWQQSSSHEPHWGEATTSQNQAAYTGFKPELPADEVHPLQQTDDTSPHLSTAAPTTLSSHSPDYSAGRVSSASTLMPDAQRQGGPGGFYVSPQSTGTSGSQAHSPHHSESPGGGGLAPLSELQG